MPRFSILVPARNEEKWLPGCLESIKAAAEPFPDLVEVIVATTHQLKRRDQSQPERVVIFPPGPGDIDLRPLSWVILKMLRLPDDGNSHAYAANMIGYLGLEEYEPELRVLLESKHPAVARAAGNALEMLGCEKPVAFFAHWPDGCAVNG